MRNCKNKQHFMREFIDKGGTVGTDVWFPTKIHKSKYVSVFKVSYRSQS